MKIRRFEEKDRKELYRLLSDPEVMKYLEAPFTEEKTKAFLEEAGMSKNPLIYAVEEDGDFLGYVIDHGFDEESIEIGWVILPDYWGKGIATKLTQELINRASLENKDVVIKCTPDHEATKHIAEKHGFVLERSEEGLNRYRLRQKQMSL